MKVPSADEEVDVPALCRDGDKEEDQYDDDEELARVIGYIVERLLGGGAGNVSSVGFVQSAEPSSFVPQQRQIWLWLS